MTTIGYRWKLRQLMATNEMFSTSDLIKPLADRGVALSREQVYRLVTQAPQRLNMSVLAAVCDILGCQPNDLIEIVADDIPRSVQQDSPTKSANTAVRALKAPRTSVRRP